MGVATDWLMERIVLRRRELVREAQVKRFVDPTYDFSNEVAVDSELVEPGKEPEAVAGRVLAVSRLRKRVERTGAAVCA